MSGNDERPAIKVLPAGIGPSSQPITKVFSDRQTLTWHYNWNENYVGCLPQTSPDLEIDAEFVPMMYVTV